MTARDRSLQETQVHTGPRPGCHAPCRVLPPSINIGNYPSASPSIGAPKSAEIAGGGSSVLRGAYSSDSPIVAKLTKVLAVFNGRAPYIQEYSISLPSLLILPTVLNSSHRWKCLMSVPRVKVSYRRQTISRHQTRLCDIKFERFGLLPRTLQDSWRHFAPKDLGTSGRTGFSVSRHRGRP